MSTQQGAYLSAIMKRVRHLYPAGIADAFEIAMLLKLIAPMPTTDRHIDEAIKHAENKTGIEVQ